MYIEGFDSTPAGYVLAVAAQAFSNECPRIGNVRQTRMNCESPRIEH
jgi:hypothetical protein